MNSIHVTLLVLAGSAALASSEATPSSEFVLGKPGEKDCPEGSEYIKDFEECKRAGEALDGDGITLAFGPGLWTEYPSWCSTWTHMIESLKYTGIMPYFNRLSHPTAAKRQADFTMICKKVSEPTGCPDQPPTSGSPCKTVGLKCDYGVECCCEPHQLTKIYGGCWSNERGYWVGITSPVTSTCTADGWSMPPPCATLTEHKYFSERQIDACPTPAPTPAPTTPAPTPAPTPSPTTPAPTPSPTPAPSEEAKLGLNGKCWSKGKNTAERDAACAGDLVCARKGYDGRGFGGCWSWRGAYRAGWPYRHHCCSKTPRGAVWKTRRLGDEVRRTGDIFEILSGLKSTEAFCEFAVESSICGLQCSDVNAEVYEFLPDGLLDVCTGTDMTIGDFCGTVCAAEE